MKFSHKVLAFSLMAAAPLMAHFQTVLSDRSVLDGAGAVQLTYQFTHPFEHRLMQMDRPVEAGVFFEGKKSSMMGELIEAKSGNFSFWRAKHQLKEPGVYQFYVDPKPYFEPAEGVFIRHITKTLVDVGGANEGWDEPIGLKAEIVPLSRPYAVYTGNIFSGQVLYKGKPAAGVIVEVGIDDGVGKKLGNPDELITAYSVKTDANGVFHAAMPFDGWWGFAALIEDDQELKHEGKSYPVELGALIWVKTQSAR
jgi:cobalt/nickel transport protein